MDPCIGVHFFCMVYKQMIICIVIAAFDAGSAPGFYDVRVWGGKAAKIFFQA